MRVEEAQRRILELLGEAPAGAAELVMVELGLGRVLAEPAVAAVTLPPWDNSAMDGYAVHSADVEGASDDVPVVLRVGGDVAAGGSRLGREVAIGEAIRIATGAPLPSGADAVVQVELTTPIRDGQPGGRDRAAGGPLPESIQVHGAVSPGTHVRRAGSDLRAGDELLPLGAALGAAQVALLAGAGVPQVRVHPRPRVAVLATGDEVRRPGEPLGESGIPDANGPGLRALVAAAGGEPIDLGVARDRLDDVLERLQRGLDGGADAVIVAGGVSVGPYDVVKAAFERLGEVALWRVAVQPGKPFALATVPRPGAPPTLLFGLPGNPVSGFVTFELFVRPALRAMAGRRDLVRPLDRAVLLDEARTSSGRRTYLRVTAERAPDGAIARDEVGRVRVRLARGPGGQGSHVLSALAAADGLAVVAEDAEVHRAGDPVGLLWLDIP